jgi:hypothetical protein
MKYPRFGKCSMLWEAPVAQAVGLPRGRRNRLPHHRRGALLAAATASLMIWVSSAQPAPEVWTFDNLQKIAGHNVTVFGHPKVIDSPIGKAVEFNGVDDALFVDVHPLAGAETFTWEAIFRPAGGAFEQRWFHLAEQDPKTGADTGNRMLFEVRIVDNDKWYLDTYCEMAGIQKTLMNRKALHPVGPWYHVAAVYDGKTLTNYVDGIQQNTANAHFQPQGPGHTSVGVRINKVSYFKGAVHLARFTRRALSPSEFLKAQ